jgi:hypothetical protein
MKEHSDKNCREYQGHYHTDITLPSEYFRPDVERPGDLGLHTLDFTYIYEKDIDNPDHFTMGVGERVREGEPVRAETDRDAKVMRMEPVVAPLSDYPELDRLVPRAD